MWCVMAAVVSVGGVEDCISVMQKIEEVLLRRYRSVHNTWKSVHNAQCRYVCVYVCVSVCLDV